MAITSSYYRLKIDSTYTTTNGATSAGNAINTALANAGREERVTQNGANIYLMIPGLAEVDALSLRTALQAGWAGQARSYFKVSLVRTEDND